MRSIYLSITTFAAILSFACSPTLQVHELNEEGKLPTSTHLSSSEVIMDKSLKIDSSYHFLFLKNSGVTNRYTQYVAGTLKNISGYMEVKTKDEMEQYVVRNNLAEKVANISDNIGLFRLQKEIGNFLICEANAEQIGRYGFKFYFKIIDPANSDVLLEIDHYGVNWAGLDRPLFNPVFNYYIDWLKKNKS